MLSLGLLSVCNVVLTGGIHDRYNVRNEACWTQQILIDTIKTFRPSYSLWIFWSFIKHKPTFSVAIRNNDWYSFHFLVGESKLIFARVHSYVPNRVRFMLTKTRVHFFPFLLWISDKEKSWSHLHLLIIYVSNKNRRIWCNPPFYTLVYFFLARSYMTPRRFSHGRNWKVMKNEEIIIKVWLAVHFRILTGE